MIRKTLLGSFMLLLALGAAAQSATFSHADSLRGSLRPERTCYDVGFYDLNVKVDPESQRISGSNDISFKALNDFSTLQIDLFDNMLIDETPVANKPKPKARKSKTQPA